MNKFNIKTIWTNKNYPAIKEEKILIMRKLIEDQNAV